MKMTGTAGNRPEGERVFLLGGSFMVRLERYLAGPAAGKRIGPSPLSDYALSADGTEMLLWRDELDTMLADAAADWLILDLQRAESMLYTVNRQLYTIPETGAEGPVPEQVLPVEPETVSKKRIGIAFRALAGVLLRHFPPERIILLHTHRPPFWLGGSSLHDLKGLPHVTQEQRLWLFRLERYFRRLTGCRYLNVSRFYFYRKEKGRPVTNVIYEDECYLDTARRVAEMMRDDADTGDTPRPDFALSLRRYAAYKQTLYQKAFPLFLDRARFPDALVLAADAAFVRAHFEELVRLDTLDWTDIPAALRQAGEMGISEGLLAVMRAFYAVTAGEDGACSEGDLAAMFGGVVVPKNVLEALRERAAEFSLLPEQINRRNAGLYYARAHGLNETAFRTADTVEKPYPVDIFGSCVSRTAFNLCPGDTAVLHYWFHVPPLEGSNPAVEYPAGLFPERPKWQDRMVKAQLDRDIHRQIRESAAQWLIVDFFSLTARHTYLYQGAVFTDFRKQISAKLGAGRVFLQRDAAVRGTPEELMAHLDAWCDTVREKYGGRIILINAYRSALWRGDDGMIYRYPIRFTQNELVYRAFEYVRGRLDCYAINVAEQFTPDDESIMRREPVHTEDLCYEYYHDLCLSIMAEMPEKKLYDTVPAEVRLRRLLRLSPENPAEALRPFFPAHELNDALFRMERGELEAHLPELAALYENGSGESAEAPASPVRRAIGRLRRSVAGEKGEKNGELRALLAAAKARPLPAERPLRTAYPAYRPEEGIFSGRTGLYRLPELPKLRDAGLRREDGKIVLSWRTEGGSAAVPASVWVYRRRKGHLSKRIAVTEAVACAFSEPLPAKAEGLQYLLRIVVEYRGKRYMGELIGPLDALPGEKSEE